MKPYLDLLRHVRENGVRKPTRCVLRSTGEHVDALSVFAPPSFRWDLRDGFPLVTTKRVDFDAVARELLWFLSGSTNVEALRDAGVRIWDEWADGDGEVGPIYGAQWRDWRCHRNGSHDQIRAVADGIEAVKADPRDARGRRLVLSAWNVGELDEMALPPCHLLSIFNVADGRLSCKTAMRSADLFLGVPYNIASYALLTHMLARVTGLDVGTLTISFGDAHVYANHLGQVDEQLTREPRALPAVWFNPDVRDIDEFRREDFLLVGYDPHPALRGEVAV